MRRPKKNRGGKRVQSHPIYCQTSTATLMQMYKLPRLWMYLKFDHISYPRTRASCPGTSHATWKNKKRWRPEFPPNEFRINESFFPHIFYLLYYIDTISTKATKIYICHVLILMEGGNLAAWFCIHFPKYQFGLTAQEKFLLFKPSSTQSISLALVSLSTVSFLRV